MGLFCRHNFGHLMTDDIPDKPRQLTGDGDTHQRGVLARLSECLVAPTEAFLCLPGNVSGLFGRIFGLAFEVHRLTCREAVTPGRFHSHPAGVAIAGFGDRALAAFRAAAVFARYEP